MNNETFVEVDEELFDDECDAAQTGADHSNAGRMARHEGKRPDLGHLKIAIDVITDENGKDMLVPLFNVGEQIVVERRTSLLDGNPWIGTECYTVREIDDDTGDVKLWNHQLLQFAYANYIKGLAIGEDWRFANRAGGYGFGGSKRARRKLKAGETSAASYDSTAASSDASSPLKVKRVRRPKDVVREEKTKRQAERKARMDARQAKRLLKEREKEAKARAKRAKRK